MSNRSRINVSLLEFVIFSAVMTEETVSVQIGVDMETFEGFLVPLEFCNKIRSFGNTRCALG